MTGKTWKRLAGAVAVGALVGGLGLTMAAQADPNPAPPPPPWVNSDGSVDPAKIPDSVAVVGPDGKPVRDRKGNEIRYNLRDKLRPPANPPAASNTPRDSLRLDDGTPVKEAEPQRPY
ncbi:hypothetical protein SAMN05421869_15354 [Nonomuraea jiangxiensis]|uniref:Uncharacterized protein n=1 Tax=Nonomuraea jiangxiensis TaxID=633440 RepID=A0A1G9VLE6_9ACTN|nr:hypothetical protein SAMN05421869_15354 [Nonomuraea jiangxiensis]